MVLQAGLGQCCECMGSSHTPHHQPHITARRLSPSLDAIPHCPLLSSEADAMKKSHAFISSTGTNYKSEPVGKQVFSPTTLSPPGFILTGTAMQMTWQPPFSRPRGSPGAPLRRRQPGSMAAQGEAALSGLCMWYTSLSSSSGTCSTARPAQLMRPAHTHEEGGSAILCRPPPPGLTSQ